jgi:hypothetical protein
VRVAISADAEPEATQSSVATVPERIAVDGDALPAFVSLLELPGVKHRHVTLYGAIVVAYRRGLAPTTTSLCRALRVSDQRMLRRWLRQLETAGVIEWTRGKNPGALSRVVPCGPGV